MGFQRPSILTIVFAILAAVAFVFCIAALAAHTWYTISASGITANYGLWEGCVESTCSSYENEEDWLRAARAFVILAFLLLIGTIALVIVSMFVESLKKKLLMVGGILSFVAGVFVLIGAIIFVVEIEDLVSGGHAGAAFGVAIIDFFLANAAGIVGLVASIKEP